MMGSGEVLGFCVLTFRDLQQQIRKKIKGRSTQIKCKNAWQELVLVPDLVGAWGSSTNLKFMAEEMGVGRVLVGQEKTHPHNGA